MKDLEVETLPGWASWVGSEVIPVSKRTAEGDMGETWRRQQRTDEAGTGVTHFEDGGTMQEATGNRGSP